MDRTSLWTNVMRQAVVDIGSNSILLLVAEVDQYKKISPVFQSSRVSRLAEGLQTELFLKPQAMERSIQAIAACLQEAQTHAAEKVLLCATEVLRKAVNQDVFLNLVQKAFGCEIRILTGEEEAQNTFWGSIADLPLSGFYIVVDVGGGSTEIVKGTKNEIMQAFSFPMGAVLLAEKYHYPVHLSNAIVASVKKEINNTIENKINTSDFINLGNLLVGYGGTLSTLAMLDQNLVSYDSKQIHGYPFSRERLAKLFDAISKADSAYRIHKMKIEAGRQDIILFGMLIYDVFMEKLGCDTIYVSDRGVRFGIAANPEFWN